MLQHGPLQGDYYLPSAVILISEISAGVPTNAPIPPAVHPITAFMKKFGFTPSLK